MINQNLHKGSVKNLLAFIFVFASLSLSAQLNPKNYYVNVKANEPVYVDLASQAIQPSVVVFPASYDSLGFQNMGGGNWQLYFEPSPDFIGDTKLVVQYYEAAGLPGLFLPNYSTFYYRVKESKIDCDSDDAIISASGSTEVDVLSNDNTTDGILTLVELGHVEGGTASISNNKISITPAAGSTEAYVRYFTSDDTENIESSVLYAQLDNDQLQDQRSLFVDKLSTIDLRLSSESYVDAFGPSNGTLTKNGHVWTYDPNNNFTGTDSISFTTTNGGLIEYSIEVLNKIDNRSFVRDDQFFVVTNGSITFNVFDNDYLDDFNIIDHSPELTYLGDGEFSYTPASDFTGDLVFYYKIFAGFQFHTGDIVIHVDDFAPAEDLNYHFTILNDHDLVIDHEAPIDDYYFQTVQDPQNGSLIILDSNENEVLDCEIIQGDNTIIYIPDPGFNEVDNFSVEFCTTTGICETIDVEVDVLSSSYMDCLCLVDCVYLGDNNNDGVVSTKDVLDLALNLGEGGFDRTNDFDLFWTGQESMDWGHEQLHSDTDLKNGDADGNGYLEYDDIAEFENYYSLVHSFVANEVGELSSVPISFVPQSTDVDSGEWMFIDIIAGSSSQPALDMYGVAFSFNMDPDVIDSSSVNLVVHDNNWLGKGSPLYEFMNVPYDGKVDIAMSRINNVSVDGIGIIATLEFIIEDEVEGFKDIFNSYVDKDITMTDIISVNEYGDFKLHPESTKTIQVASELAEEEEFVIEDQLNIYPNPTNGLIVLESDKFSIDRVELYDIVGRRIDTRNIYNNYRATIDMSPMQEGVYLARVYINGQVVTKKIQKLDL